MVSDQPFNRRDILGFQSQTLGDLPRDTCTEHGVVFGTAFADINEALADEPELVNSSPYESGWVFRLQPADAQSLDELMDADAYGRFLAELDD